MQQIQNLSASIVSVQFPPATKPVQEDGWLSLDGTYYPCGCYHHSKAAEEIAGLSVYRLERKGWIHISGGDIKNSPMPEFTQAQRDMLFDMFMINQNSYFASNIGKVIGMGASLEEDKDDMECYW